MRAIICSQHEIAELDGLIAWLYSDNSNKYPSDTG